MNNEQYIKNLAVPSRKIDMVLDTDAYNEVDDQFAICYMLASGEKLNIRAIYAAPFLNSRSSSPADGMEKSYDEILKLLELAGKKELSSIVHKGSDRFLPDECTPVVSDAAKDLVKRASEYSPENPLYVVAIGAITNVASALIMEPSIAENIVIVWLGGHAHHLKSTAEFNMVQDIASARIVMGCGAPFVQLPCIGVVDRFMLTPVELKHYIGGKNQVCDYLCENVIDAVKHVPAGISPSRVIWDVTAVAWLLNEEGKFMRSELVRIPVPEYDKTYGAPTSDRLMTYVTSIDRDKLAGNLFSKLSEL